MISKFQMPRGKQQRQNTPATINNIRTIFRSRRKTLVWFWPVLVSPSSPFRNIFCRLWATTKIRTYIVSMTVTRRNKITQREILNATILLLVLSARQWKLLIRIPLAPESGVAEYVASAVEINQMIKIILNDFEVVILDLYWSGLLILRYRSKLMNVSVTTDAVIAKLSIHTMKRHKWIDMSCNDLESTLIPYTIAGPMTVPTKRSATARQATRYLFGWWRLLSLQVANKTKVLPVMIRMLIKVYKIIWTGESWSRNS